MDSDKILILQQQATEMDSDNVDPGNEPLAELDVK